MQHPSVQPLNTLLEHAERERDDALAQQQRAEAAMRGAENQVHQLLAYRGECERRWTERSRAGTTPTLMLCHQTFIGRLQTAVDMQGEVVQRAQAEVQRCREQLLALELRVASVRKLIERREAGAFSITQTHARHILLRPSAQLTQDAAVRRLAEFKRIILARSNSFEQLAKDNSEDGSAPQGGDLGWASPGQFVPEFEEAMNALPLGGISDPLVSRFGVHLIQVIDRRQATLDPKQQREQAKNVLREQKFDQAYLEWLRDLRARAYIEMREPPV